MDKINASPIKTLEDGSCSVKLENDYYKARIIYFGNYLQDLKTGIRPSELYVNVIPKDVFPIGINFIVQTQDGNSEINVEVDNLYHCPIDQINQFHAYLDIAAQFIENVKTFIQEKFPGALS